MQSHIRTSLIKEHHLSTSIGCQKTQNQQAYCNWTLFKNYNDTQKTKKGGFFNHYKARVYNLFFLSLYESGSAYADIKTNSLVTSKKNPKINQSLFQFQARSWTVQNEMQIDRPRFQENHGNPVTKKARNMVWIRIAAHSRLTTTKSLGWARTTVATAAENALSTPDEEESEASDIAPKRAPFEPPEALLHSFHFRPLPFSYKIHKKSTLREQIEEWEKQKLGLIGFVKW